KEELSEAGRLYNINCAICHGSKGHGDGPIAEKVPGVANLTSDLFKAMADGTMYHSIEYGKNNMGSYASQLTPRERWQIIKYIRTLQGPAAAQASTTASADSAKKQ
ncbi:MAG TPA: cytochrome c, partial [Ferruginibacter sp.]|nr:cytochrome c [Ferruginibacter sp.]